jgi:hypothetical protein
VPLRIRLSRAADAADLLAFLRDLTADAWRDGRDVYVMRRHPVVPGEPNDQFLVEVGFAVRGWEAMRRPGAIFSLEEMRAA